MRILIIFLLCISFVAQAEKAVTCSDYPVNLRRYPSCTKENSCIVSFVDNPWIPFSVDRAVHDFKCMIIVESSLKEIPSTIFLTLKSNISHFYANNVHLSELRRISFAFGQNLREVSLAENQIKSIQETVFYDAPYLETLDLSNNQISEFSSDAFEKLSSLKILDLSRNSITTIPFELFHPLTNIVFLNLRHNRVQIKFGIFPEFVKTLDLSYNSLDLYTKFKIFTLLNYLETLLLHGNKIENIHNSIFESNLKFLGISDNLFPCSVLADIFIEMKKSDIVSAPDEQFVKNTSNIRGIKCIE